MKPWYKLGRVWLLRRSDQWPMMVLFITTVLLLLLWWYLPVWWPTPQSTLMVYRIHWPSAPNTTVQSNKIWPFNPNFMSPQKADRLGLSAAQYRRLLLFRQQGKWLHSAKEFQQITQVSNPALQRLAPYFKFPQWKGRPMEHEALQAMGSTPSPPSIDLNLADAQTLESLPGIGPVLAARIVAFRERLGGFFDLAQLLHVWGIREDVFEKIRPQLRCSPPINPLRIPLQQATVDQLIALPYLSYRTAKKIVVLRTRLGSLDCKDLTTIDDLSDDKLKFIALYLDFEKK